MNSPVGIVKYFWVWCCAFVLVFGLPACTSGVEKTRQPTVQIELPTVFMQTNAHSPTGTPLSLLPTITPAPVTINAPTAIPPTITTAPVFEAGSTTIGRDNMILIYVPAGSFTKGSDYGAKDEKPAPLGSCRSFLD